MMPDERGALERLIEVALGVTDQAAKVASFLLAWWDAQTYGGFDPRVLWSVDRAIAQDMAAVFAMLARVEQIPDSLGYGPQFEALAKKWR